MGAMEEEMKRAQELIKARKEQQEKQAVSSRKYVKLSYIKVTSSFLSLYTLVIYTNID